MPSTPRPGYRKSLRKTFAETIDNMMFMPQSLFWNCLFMGAGMTTGLIMHDEWDDAQATPAQTKEYTQILDQDFSDLAQIKSDMMTAQNKWGEAKIHNNPEQISHWRDQFAALESQMYNQAEIFQDKVFTPVISEKQTEAYLQEFNDMGYHSYTSENWSRYDMEFRNECLTEPTRSHCLRAESSKERDEITLKWGVPFALSPLILSMALAFSGLESKWKKLPDIPKSRKKWGKSKLPQN